MALPRKILEEKFRKFVEEDVGHGDVTTFCTISQGIHVEAEAIVKENGTIAGIEEALVFAEAFGLQAESLVKDGSKVTSKTRVLHLEGDAATLLIVERTMLNLLSRMSGIATYTNRLVEKVRRAGYKTAVAATRKTGLGLGYFDKKAVTLGRGEPHRYGLDDMILIKDNHIAIAGSITDIVRNTRKRASFSKKIEVEVSRPRDVLNVAESGIDILMLDNFTPKQTSDAIGLLKERKIRNKVLVEASGGITEQNILKYAAAGVDIVSLGEITQSARALDISLEITKAKKQ